MKLEKYMQTQLQWKLRVPAEQRPESLAGYPRLEDWLRTADLTPQLIRVCVFVCVYFVDLYSRLCFWANQKNANHPIKALQVGLKKCGHHPVPETASKRPVK